MSSVMLLALLMPVLEVYSQIDLPYVNIDMQNFNIFGYEVSSEKQLGVMMMCGVLMMLPGSLIPLSIMKLKK